MADFVKLLAANEIIKKLDENNVPGKGLTWDRIILFAQSYQTIEISDVVIEEPSERKLSEDQKIAWEKLQAWIFGDNPFFVLRGYAGSGKTYLLQLLKTLNKKDILFTAPTNKATKVISKAVKSKAVTTFSALGIKMTQDEDGLILKFSDTPPYIPAKTVLIVDECSMVGEVLYNFIIQTQMRTGCKILFVGDPAQLPPVGELRSKTWQATKNTACRAFLKQIMRYDNELLTLATRIRECIQAKTYDAYIEDANNGKVGVFLHRNIIEPILSFKNPSDWSNRKIIAWRNKTVDNYNNLIRENFGFTKPYHNGDIILAADPIEIDGNIVATVDEEFTVIDVHKDLRRVLHDGEDYEIPVWRLSVTGDQDLELYVPVNVKDLEQMLAEKALYARTCEPKKRRAAWKDFWSTKTLFHRVRYGYALTAHRAQGSTYEEVFVDQRDILANSNKREAFRCLYVSSTRATTSIHSF